MIPVTTANLAIWTGIGGVLSSILIRSILMLWEFITEIFVDVTGLRIVKMRGSLPNTIHSAILHYAFGLKQTYRTEKMSYPCGMFISIKHRFCGVLTIEQDFSSSSTSGARFAVTIWSFADVMPLLYQSMNNKLQIYQAAESVGHQNIIIDVPRPNTWQNAAAEYVDSVFERKTSGGLVMLITGHPGCGKSTFPYIYAHRRQMTSVCVASINGHTGAGAVANPRCMVILNEIDVSLPVKVILGPSNTYTWDGVRRITKEYFNSLMDVMHTSTTAGIIVMTTNKSFAELCEQIPDNGAESMFRHGRLDIIFNVTHDLNFEVVREYKPVANKPPEPYIAPAAAPAAAASNTDAAASNADAAALDYPSADNVPTRTTSETPERVNVDITVSELIELLRKSQKDA